MPENDFLELAQRMGAAHAVIFKVSDIEFDPRTILKCMFGCGDWGKGPTCPSRPGSLMPWDYRQIFEKYSWGVIVHSPDKKIAQQASLAIEREAFRNGYYFAFSLSDCALCQECAGLKGCACLNPKLARPAFHSVGIDVFKTVHKFDLPLKTLQSPDEPQNWYSAVFIE